MSRKRDIVKKWSFLIEFLIRISKFLPKSFYIILLKKIRHCDSYLAMLIRFICLKNCAKKCGDNVAVFSNVYLYGLSNLEIGDNVSIHPLSYINASGGVIIGNDVSIAHSTSILSEEHTYSNLMRKIKDQGHEFKKTMIDNNVWIGAGVRVLAGSVISSGSIVAAGAVVKGEFKENIIIGGIPAKIIKERT